MWTSEENPWEVLWLTIGMDLIQDATCYVRYFFRDAWGNSLSFNTLEIALVADGQEKML